MTTPKTTARPTTKAANKKGKATKSKKASADYVDPYQAVTNRIVEALEGGVIPWRKGWNPEFGMPRNYATGHVYSGVNAFLLALSPVGEYPLFMTYKQAQELGGQVRGGEHGQKVIVAGFHEDKKKGAAQGDGEQKSDGYTFFREFTVFNICQIDGIDWKLPELMKREFTPNEAAEKMANGYLDRPNAPSLNFGGSQAYYWPMGDAVQMPPKFTFRSEQAFYRTLFHELAHSTGAANRLNRSEVVSGDKFGSYEYGREELVAEMTTAFLNAELGYAPEPEGDQHASYIQSWLKIIRADSRLVVGAASAAQKAAYWIKGVKAPEYEGRAAA